jgi:hypothetical protein
LLVLVLDVVPRRLDFFPERFGFAELLLERFAALVPVRRALVRFLDGFFLFRAGISVDQGERPHPDPRLAAGQRAEYLDTRCRVLPPSEEKWDRSPEIAPGS